MKREPHPRLWPAAGALGLAWLLMALVCLAPGVVAGLTWQADPAGLRNVEFRWWWDEKQQQWCVVGHVVGEHF